jgi:4,5-DOPA dioxygenase extradiol
MMPALFIGHGSPMNAILDNEYTRGLRRLGERLPRPKAVMVVSAHWLARGVQIQCSARPEQIYDFYGFPEELYRVRYAPPGAPDAAAMAADAVSGGRARLTEEWGIDHAAWAVMRHMYPRADVPVFEMGLDVDLDERAHIGLARELRPLREEGILIMGSGNLVHNLRLISHDADAQPFPWAIEADTRIAEMLDARDLDALADFPHSMDAGRMAIPTNEHFLPALYAAALGNEDERIEYVNDIIQNGSISMRSFVVS